MQFDFMILGGGIVGLSTAMQLQSRLPNHRILLLEKAPALASHQTGHNSGVIHAGIYYPPGSFKANFCATGAEQLKAFCRRQRIPFAVPGKLVVATDGDEERDLQRLYDYSQQRQVPVDYLDRRELRAREPAVNGRAALWVKTSGIVDFTRVARVYADCFADAGGEWQVGMQVTDIMEDDRGVTVKAGESTYRARFLIACCGLQADRVAHAMGVETDFRILPVRGEYYQLSPRWRDRVSHLIYPVPDPAMPFLGVHLTPLMDGRVAVGPNAVMGWHREGYPKGSFNWRDTWESLRYPGFWRLARRHWRFALGEMTDSLVKRRYWQRVRQYCPDLPLNDLQAFPAGIRAQAVNREGELLQDFLFGETPRSLHVCNAPSPAATASLPIGRYLCDKLIDSGRY